jgi:hypothetical protein
MVRSTNKKIRYIDNMKYIKLFEDLSSDKYRDVSNSIDEILPIEFNDKEGNLLNKIGFNNHSDDGPLCYTNDNGEWDPRNPSTFINIYKEEDEWYYVASYRRYEKENGYPAIYQDSLYKCDQWDGLIDCLKKEFNIL